MKLYETALRELAKQRGLNYVSTRGNISSPVVFIGEAPGVEEQQQGIPFVGASGKLADRNLSSVGFSSQDVWFTNVYKLRPPDNDIKRIAELGVPYEAYENQFFEELEATKPTLIIVAGATPLQMLCPATRNRKTDRTDIGKWRGSLLTSARLTWPHYIIPIYHPAFILRDWSEHDTNVFILKKVKEEYDYWRVNHQLKPLPERELIVEPTANVALDFLSDCLRQQLPISIDIELLRRRVPYVIGFATSPWRAISVPLWSYSNDVCANVWRLINDILSTKRQIGQNYTSFDLHWLWYLGFNVNATLVDDTRIRHNILWPELSHKLEFMVMQYTREPYYKDEGKGWQPRDGIRKLMLYNCKDAACTYEVYLEQEKELDERPHLRDFYNKHERKLATNMFNIERRGVKTNPTELASLRTYIDKELQTHCANISTHVGRPVGPDKQSCETLGPTTVNLNSPQQVIEMLKGRGLKIPKKRDTGNESVGEEQLNNLFAETNDPVLKEILDVRELSKIGSTNVNCRLIDDIYYSVYIVGGTVGGRRASKGNPLGFGGNGQNIPKHSKLGKRFRRCLVAREGKVFVLCDQIAAEDWIINGIIADQTGDDHAIIELKTGVDRHQKLASFIFGIPLDQCSRESPTIHRYVGKRTRYAGSYGMGGDKFKAVLAKEGFSLPGEYCAYCLQKFHEYDPGIKGVFQAYVEKELVDKRMLRDLFGRERDFFGLHPFRDNSKIFRDAYSYIPQSSIGDNNGAAINFCEEHGFGLALLEVHDSIGLEVDDNVESVLSAIRLLEGAYDRTLTFPRGYQVKIPIEVELGYNMQDTVRCENLNEAGLRNTYATLVQQASPQSNTTSGAQQHVSVQP